MYTYLLRLGVKPHKRLDHPMRDELLLRQYARPGETSFDQVMARVSAVLFPDDKTHATALFHMLMNGEFQFGGRVLAGAGTEHGNLLNCFVQDEHPFKPGSTEGALHLAKKLALVTKVGGGNGLNLDAYPPKQPFMVSRSTRTLGRPYLTISPDHADHDKVRQGTFYDQVTGQYVTRGYDTLVFVPHGSSLEPGVRTHTVPDSIDGIWHAAAVMVKEILAGNDVLIDLSALRPEGSPVRGSGGTSSGPASFAVEIFNNFAKWAYLGGADYAGPVATLRYLFAPTLRVIRQGGTRRGAGMATLSVDHPDIEDFITAKDLEREGREGDISTFNISVLVSDTFMNQATGKPRVYDDATANAHALLRKIAEHAHATGEPGIQFTDTINWHNMVRETQGEIRATNPCGEIGLLPGEPCDLGAINLAAFVDENGEFDFPRFGNAVSLAVRALDRVLDVEQPPLPEIGHMIKRNRRIGLGVMGLADMLVRMGCRYDDLEGHRVVHAVIDRMRQMAIATSVDLADELGVPEGVSAAGFQRRNVALLTVAPTGTIAAMTGVSSGIEPIFSAVTYRRIGTTYHRIVHPLLEEIFGRHFDYDQGESLEDVFVFDLADKISEHHGSIQWLFDELPEGSTLRDDPCLKAFVTAHEINPLHHVEMQAIVQRTFDWDELGNRTFAGNSISKTINLPHYASVDDVFEAYRRAWTSGCKGITVYRDGSRDLQVLNTSNPEEEEEDVDTSRPPETREEASKQIRAVIAEKRSILDALAPFDGAEYEHDAPEDESPYDTLTNQLVDEVQRIVDKYNLNTGRQTPRLATLERPQMVLGASYKFKVGGEKVYIQAFSNDDNQLVEVWTPASKGASPNEQTTHNIIGRLISLALKHGASPEKIAQSLEGHRDDTGGIVKGVGFVGSKWSLVAHVIRDTADTFRQVDKIVHEEEMQAAPSSQPPPHSPRPARSANLCPACGRAELVHQDGCKHCNVCHYSSCG